jgi:hypothetical protein
MDAKPKLCLLASLLICWTILVAPAARAADGDVGTAPPAPSTGEARSASPAATTSLSIEERLERQAGLLEQMRELVTKQQAEIDRLQTEIESMRKTTAHQDSSLAAAATPAAGVSPDPRPAADQDELSKKVEDLSKRWGKLKLSGDLRFRYEGFFNQGFDGPTDVDSRNRLRMRARAQLSGEIDKHFDWAVRITTGSFTDPISTNQSLTDFYNRKPIGLDRAFIHFNSKTDPVQLDLVAGKFDFPWKRTLVTFDNDLQPEGIAESLKFDTGDGTPLRAVKLTAWQLPFKERSVGADAFILGGQILTEWKLSDNWSASLSGAFHDFEQVDLIPPSLNVSPTLVNAGLEYGTTNVVVVNPFTGAPQFRSEFRVIDTIAELKYTGFDEHWPLILRANWIHNTSAFNNQKDGGLASVELGRRQDKGDWFFGWDWYKTEREVFPSVFMESDFIQTNGLSHRLSASYMYLKNVEFDVQYILTRRLQTTAPENRWLNRVQVDFIYKW